MKDRAQNSGRCDPTSAASQHLSAVERMMRAGVGGFVSFVFFRTENIANHYNLLCYFYLFFCYS